MGWFGKDKKSSTGAAGRSDAEIERSKRKAAEHGDALSQFVLGTMYAKGQGVPKDDAEAVRWFRKAAEQGHSLAQNTLGMRYALGQGVPKDDAEAVRWYRKTAEQGDATAQGLLGVMYDEGRGVPKDDGQAFLWFHKAAEQGNATAQAQLGARYANGQGVSQDYAEAVRWYRKAAEQGNAQAQYYLGYMYEKDQGVPKDDAEAVRWFRKAAEQDDALAQYSLGIMYVNARGVPQDNVQAFKWLTLAMARLASDQRTTIQQHDHCRATRDKVAATMTSAQIALAQRQVAEWRGNTLLNMDRGRNDAEIPVIQFGSELGLFLARLITKAFIAALIIAIVAAVLIFQHGVSTRIGILLGGAVLSPVALFAYHAVIIREARSGTVNRGIRPLVALGGFIPYAFGCYLVFYEGLGGLVRLLYAFTFGSLLAATFYVIAGYLIVLGIYRVSEFGRAVDEGRVVIKKKVASRP